MARIRNVSPWGALDVPLLGRIVDAGEVVDVDDVHAVILLDQPDNWAADTAASAPVQPIVAPVPVAPDPEPVPEPTEEAQP